MTHLKSRFSLYRKKEGIQILTYQRKVCQWYLNTNKNLKKTVFLSSGLFKIKLTLFLYKILWGYSKNAWCKISANKYGNPLIRTGTCARLQSLGLPQSLTEICVTILNDWKLLVIVTKNAIQVIGVVLSAPIRN